MNDISTEVDFLGCPERLLSSLVRVPKLSSKRVNLNSTIITTLMEYCDWLTVGYRMGKSTKRLSPPWSTCSSDNIESRWMLRRLSRQKRVVVYSFGLYTPIPRICVPMTSSPLPSDKNIKQSDMGERVVNSTSSSDKSHPVHIYKEHW